MAAVTEPSDVNGGVCVWGGGGGEGVSSRGYCKNAILTSVSLK